MSEYGDVPLASIQGSKGRSLSHFLKRRIIRESQFVNNDVKISNKFLLARILDNGQDSPSLLVLNSLSKQFSNWIMLKTGQDRRID